MRKGVLSLLLIFLMIISVQGASLDIEYVSIEWMELTPEQSPQERFHHAMVYDSDHDKVIMIGGNVAGVGESITWEYDYSSNSWTDRNATNPPPRLNYHAMAYDSSNKKTVLFGGVDFTTNLPNERTYAYDYPTNNWTQLLPDSSPPRKRAPNMVFDETNERIVLFGGITFQEGGGFDEDDDTWVYDYKTNNWTQIPTETQPGRLATVAMTYIPTIKKILLYGGSGTYHGEFARDTWLFDVQTDTWTNMNISDFPVHGETDVVYDPTIDRVILYGGHNGSTDLDDLWVFNPSDPTWEMIDDYEGGPGLLMTEQSMVYNIQHNVTLFFGGGKDDGGSGIRQNGTWSLKFNLEVQTSSTTTSSSSSTISTSSSDTSEETQTTSDSTSTEETSLYFTPLLIVLFRRRHSKI